MRAAPSLRTVVVSVVAALATAWSAHATSVPQPVAYHIICHPTNSVSTIDRRSLEDLFLKKVTVWPSGRSARPVDLPASFPSRRRFSEEILNRPVEAVRRYWQQRIFSGRELPPPELGSDAEVVRFVLHEPGGVGYVSSGTPLDGAKVIAVD